MLSVSKITRMVFYASLGIIIFASITQAQGFRRHLSDVRPLNINTVAQNSSESEVPFPYTQWTGHPQWLAGKDWGGDAFNGSVEIADNFFYDTDMSGSEYVPVKIRITPSETTYCQVYRREAGFQAAGIGVFPGSAWDISDPDNPRRLNLVFLEDGFSNDATQANFYWDPDSSEDGAYEQLFVMSSTYDGTGETYDNDNYAPNADAMYVWWPRLVSGYDFFPTDPSSLTIRLASYAIENLSVWPSQNQLEISWEFMETDVDSLYLYFSNTPQPDQLLRVLPRSTSHFVHTDLVRGTDYYYRLKAYDEFGNLQYVSKEKWGSPQIVSQNMTLLQRWDQRSDYGDTWGYTDPNTGTEYALLCARNEGLSIIDITGDQAVEVGFEPSITPEIDSKDVKVYQHYAVLINEDGPAQVIDLLDPTNPQTVATIGIGSSNSGAHNCYIAGHYLYIVGDHGTGGLTIYNIADPVNPVQAGSYQPHYYHDIYVRNDTAYAAAINGQGIDILDVSDKSNIQKLANFNYEGSGAHNVWTTEDGNYAFVGDEVGSAGNWTRVFDISDLDNIEKGSEIIVDSAAITHNFYVRGDYLYIAHYTEGIRVWDIADPTSPTEAGFYDTYFPDHYGFYGAWSVYPYFTSEKIIASDMESGLFVLEFDVLPPNVKHPGADTPDQFTLKQNYPNPFNPVTTIEYSIPQQSHISIAIYDVRGNRITTLVHTTLDAGSYTVQWNASERPSGMYFYRITDGTYSETRKLTIMK